MPKPNDTARDEKTVRRLDDFPKLKEALREGDLATVRILCAQLFEFDSDAQTSHAPATKRL